MVTYGHFATAEIGQGQDDLIHPLIYRVALHHHLAKIEATVSL
jgi:hypothetical protein